jgi:hypothetical protein
MEAGVVAGTLAEVAAGIRPGVEVVAFRGEDFVAALPSAAAADSAGT